MSEVLIIEGLLHVLCIVTVCLCVQYFSYVMSVLLPECMIRILADVNNIDFAQVCCALHV